MIQEAIHEYRRNIYITKRRMISETDEIADEEALKQDLSAKKLIIYGTTEGNLWLAKHICSFSRVRNLRREFS